MKQANSLLEKVGIDKVLHFLVGYAIVATAAIFGIIPAVVATFLTFVLAGLKESIDEREAEKANAPYEAYDWRDIGATMLGTILPLILAFVRYGDPFGA